MLGMSWSLPSSPGLGEKEESSLGVEEAGSEG